MRCLDSIVAMATASALAVCWPANAAAIDQDSDGIADSLDNCTAIANSDQLNVDFDSLGDACDNCPAITNDDQMNTVALSGDANADGRLAGSDIIWGVNYLFRSGPAPLPSVASGDVNCNGVVNSSDLIALIGRVFKGGSRPCNVCLAAPSGWWCGEYLANSAYFPSTVGSSWTFEVHDTAVHFNGDTDSIYWQSASVDTVVLSVVGLDTLHVSGAPASVWQFDASMPAMILFERFYSTFASFGQAADTMWIYVQESATFPTFRLPLPLEVGQEWCDRSCTFEWHARTADSETVFMNGQPLGTAFVVERRGYYFEGFWRRTEWVVPQIGFARIAYSEGNHDGGGTDYVGNRGVMYLISYAIVP